MNMNATMTYFRCPVCKDGATQNARIAVSASRWILMRFFRSLVLTFATFVALFASVASASAQNAPTSSDPVRDETSAPPRNAYADTLKPRLKRSAAFQNQPYNPIRKQDDQTQIPEIEMFVGESRVFPTPGVGRIAVGNGQIMTAAALDGKEVIIFANGVGTSSLFVWNEDGRYQRIKVNIVPGDTTRIAREVAAFLTTIPQTKASIVGDKVIVEGDNLSDADISKIEELGKRYPQIVNFTNRLGWEPMVMMDVKVVEFPVDELREIGMKWNAVGGAAIGGIWRPIRRGNDGPYQINIQTGQNNAPPIVGSDGTSSDPVQLPSSLNILGAANLGLNAQLNLLAQNGKATILSEPQLAARSGSKASFLAGGEFPYSVVTRDGIAILFKQYGVKLDIQPKVDRNGVIRATIESEVSKIDSSVSTPSGPALLSRKTNTEFNVKSGETIVLSGLVQMDNGTSIDKVPLLGDVPILGALFRSKRFQNKETELVVFVTPTVVDARTSGLVDRIERVDERLQRDFGRTPYLSNPLQPGQDPAHPNAKPATPHEAEKQSTMPSAAPTPGDAVQNAPSANLAPADQNSLPAFPPATTGGSTLRVKMEGVVVRAEPNAIGVGVGAGDLRQVTATSDMPRRESSAKRYRVAVEQLALRVTPDMNAPIIQRLPAGHLVEALPQPPTRHWIEVQANDVRGWVAIQWLNPVGTSN